MSQVVIGFLSYNADNSDSFQFLTLSSLEGEQVIHFTDNGVTSSGTFRDTEGFLSWRAPPNGLIIGSVVTIDISNRRTSIGSLFDVGNIDFSTGGDQLIAFSGSRSSPSFVAALNNNEDRFQSDASDSQTSAIPPGLILGQNAVAVEETDNIVYSGPTVGTISELSSFLFDGRSFSGSDTVAQEFQGSFVITDADATRTPTVPVTSTPTPNPTTRSPTPPTTSPESSSKCRNYILGPSISTGSMQITEANALAKSGSSRVVTVEGIVVNDLRDFAAQGFYIQALTSHLPDPPVEGEGNNSHGIFVYCETGCTGHSVQEGEFVKVTGTLGVFSENPQLLLSTVELLESSRISENKKCPDLAYAVHIVDVSLPMKTTRSFFSFQGMLVNFDNRLTITDLFGLSFGQLGLSPDRLVTPTMTVPPGSDEYFELVDLQERSYIVLDDVVGGSCPVPQLYFNPNEATRAGWEIEIDANVVMTYFGVTEQFFMVPNKIGRENIPSDMINSNPREESLSLPRENEIKFAGLNMLNYFTTLGCSNCRGADNQNEYYYQSNKLYAVIKELDAAVLGLQEVQNFEGEVLEQMIRELNQFIGQDGLYDFIAAGKIGSDAIKNAIIYKPSIVRPVGRFQTLTFTNPSDKSRPALAQTFERTSGEGESFTFVSNHLKSKGSGCDEDNGGSGFVEGEGSCGFARLKHVEQLIAWLEEDPTNSGNSNIILVGDFNSYKEERSMQLLRESGFINLAERDVQASQLYSSSFDGRFGTLDYILAAPNVANFCSRTKEWHVNSDETSFIDYNDEQASRPSSCTTKPPSYRDLSVFRSSDHDPILTHCLPFGEAEIVPAPTIIQEEDNFSLGNAEILSLILSSILIVVAIFLGIFQVYQERKKRKVDEVLQTSTVLTLTEHTL